MTKQDIIHYILNYDIRSLADRLERLMSEDRITSGACYYVYNPYEFYQLKQVMDLTYKASKSKDYFRYLKRKDSIFYSVMLEGFKKNIAKTEAFLQEQENLPFEQSQKQVLIQKGELQ